VTQSHDRRGFERWLRTVTRNPLAPADDPGEISPEARAWLQHLFDSAGPVRRDVAVREALAHQLALAEAAVIAVVNDLERTTDLRPGISVATSTENGIRIVINGGWTVPSMFAMAMPTAVAEVDE
jgi:hypothetical protein